MACAQWAWAQPARKRDVSIGGHETIVVAPQADAGKPPVGEVLDLAALGNRQKLDQMFRRGLDAARDRRCIDPARFLMPAEAAMEPILAELAAKMTTLLAAHIRPGTHIRTNVCLPRSGQILRIAADFGMTDHEDSDIDVSRGSVTSLCYMSRRPILANLHERLLVPEPTPADLARFDPFAAQARREVNWLLCMPIPDVLDTVPTRMGPKGPALLSDVAGAVFGVVNADASLISSESFPKDPLVQMEQPVWPVMLDAINATARALSRLINQPWLEDTAA